MTSNFAPSADQCVEQFLDILPTMVRVVRRHMRKRSKGLSVEQFRTMVFLRAAQAANLSEVAEYVGASLSTASRIISCLVKKGFVNRCQGMCDRRQIKLVLTARGQAVLETARAYTRGQLSPQLESLSDSDRQTILDALQLLRPLFAVNGHQHNKNGNGRLPRTMSTRL